MRKEKNFFKRRYLKNLAQTAFFRTSTEKPPHEEDGDSKDDDQLDCRNNRSMPTLCLMSAEYIPTYVPNLAPFFPEEGYASVNHIGTPYLQSQLTTPLLKDSIGSRTVHASNTPS